MLTNPTLPTFSQPARHPARYSRALLPIIAQYLKPNMRVIDPFGGVGGLAKLNYTGAQIVIGEIEYPIIAQSAGKYRVNANALYLPFAAKTFDAIVTSPTYGNRMADTYTDDSKRNTYTAAFGFPLHKNNSGRMQWGEMYCGIHELAWSQAVRVLKPRGLFILNISDHIRNGELMPVAQWHRKTLQWFRLGLIAEHEIKTPRNRFGQNAELRCAHEFIFVFQKS